MSKQYCWNDREILKYSEKKTSPIANLSTTDPTWTGLGSNPGLLGEWPGTNHLCHGIILNWDLCSGKLVIDYVNYGMAFSTRRVPFYSSSSHSQAQSLWAAGIIWKRVHFIWLYYQCLDLTNKIAVCPSYVGLFVICVYIVLQCIRGVSGPTTVWHSDDHLCRPEKQGTHFLETL